MMSVRVGAAYAGFLKEPSIDDLLDIAKSIDLDALKAKAIEYGAKPEEVEPFIERYWQIPSEDLTIRVWTTGEVVQIASGGGRDRELKEFCRRAMALLIYDEAHKRGFSVDIRIT